MKHNLNNGYVSVAIIALLTAVHSASAMPTAPTYGAPFPEIKTYQEQVLELSGSKAQQMESQRNILEAGSGKSAVEKMFGLYSPNPAIEGIGKTIRLTASDNPNQAKGYKRTLLYEKEFSLGGKFKILATDKPIETRLGKTDIDLLLEHQDSGAKVLLEVKQNKLSAQNFKDFKLKIQKLVDYVKTHGGTAAIVNRYALKTEVKEVARKKGVWVYENVATGKLSGQKSGNMRFGDMEDDMNQRLESLSGVGKIMGGVGTLGGSIQVYEGIQELKTGSSIEGGANLAGGTANTISAVAGLTRRLALSGSTGAVGAG